MVHSEQATSRVDTKLEVIVIPVSDVDRARRFYERLGWRLDSDDATRRRRARRAADASRLAVLRDLRSGSSSSEPAPDVITMKSLEITIGS